MLKKKDDDDDDGGATDDDGMDGQCILGRWKTEAITSATSFSHYNHTSYNLRLRYKRL